MGPSAGLRTWKAAGKKGWQAPGTTIWIGDARFGGDFGPMPERGELFTSGSGSPGIGITRCNEAVHTGPNIWRCPCKKRVSNVYYSESESAPLPTPSSAPDGPSAPCPAPARPPQTSPGVSSPFFAPSLRIASPGAWRLAFLFFWFSPHL